MSRSETAEYFSVIRPRVIPLGSVRALYDFQPQREQLYEFLARRTESGAGAEFSVCALCVDRKEDASELALPRGAWLIVAPKQSDSFCGLVLRCCDNGHLELCNGSCIRRGCRDFQTRLTKVR